MQHPAPRPVLPRSRVTPDGSETSLAYNEAGLLESVRVRLPGQAVAGTYVSDIGYNARGQRERKAQPWTPPTSV